MAVLAAETSQNLDRLLSLLRVRGGTMTLREIVYNSDLRVSMAPAELRSAIDLGFQNGSLDLNGSDFQLTALDPAPATA